MCDKKTDYRITKCACYMMSITMAAVSNLSPLLFLIFREQYGISYTLLGFLVVINFCTQLLVDLIFSFFSRHFNIPLVIKLMPVIAFVGLLIYAVMPKLFSDYAYFFIALGTVIFSGSSGLAEVLTSPIIAAIPSDNPEKEMSKFHSSYAWGLAGVVLLGTLIIKCIPSENWGCLALIISLVPLVTSFLFSKAILPPLSVGSSSKKTPFSLPKGLFLFVFLIFFAGAAECTMAQWVSSYAENALGLSKTTADVFGMALFAFFLALGRTLHAGYAKKTPLVMLFGFLGATLMYVTSALSSNNIIGVFACMLTGLFVSMLWPGSLIIMEERYRGASVTAYAMMAAGGDLGASLAPQLVGVIADKVSVITKSEQAGMRTGILSGAVFCLLGVLVMLVILKKRKQC